MSLLPFGDLPAYKPRRFVPASVDLGDWAQVAPLFDQLEAAAAQCATVEALEAWLLDWSELSAALDEEGNRRTIAMTCHTDNAEAERAYLDFIEQVEPSIKPRQFALEKLLVAHPRRAELPRARYVVLLRDVQNRVELFRPENVALETEDTKLGQQYQKLSGSLTVEFRGEVKTLDQMSKLLEEPDRPLRQEAWEKTTERRLAERETFEEQFDAMVALRQQMAAQAGFANYRDYAFRKLGRFDYTPADCEAFHEAVASEVVPLLRAVQGERRTAMGLDRLRPWDLAVDPHARPPLRPFETIDEFTGRTRQIFEQLDPGLAAGFRQMEELRLLDLDNRPGKAPGGYQQTLAEARLPFIFMNAVGRAHDVVVLLHEAGHAFHALAARDEDVLAYRQGPPIEFCEVASMSMELIGYEGIERFYSPGDAQRARRMHLEGILSGLCWIATVDAFQHWIYTHQGHTREERRAAWLALLDRFAGDIDWTGYETARAYVWHRQLHFFIVPFYYIEYGIAQLGALQVWANYRRDRAAALTAYQRALALGGSRPLPELFAAAGCRFRFDAETIRELVELVRVELELAPAS
jgi:oligoendopeptidase F